MRKKVCYCDCELVCFQVCESDLLVSFSHSEYRLYLDIYLLAVSGDNHVINSARALSYTTLSSSKERRVPVASFQYYNEKSCHCDNEYVTRSLRACA